MCVVGIDPGMTGAVVALDESTGQILEVLDFDSYATAMANFRWLVLYHGKPKLACLEQVHMIGGASAQSATVFLTNYGWWQGVLCALQIPFILVRPVKWMGHFRLPAKTKENKKPSLDYVRQHIDLGANVNKFARKKDNGRSDSLLIAHYALFLWQTNHGLGAITNA